MPIQTVNFVDPSNYDVEVAADANPVHDFHIRIALTIYTSLQAAVPYAQVLGDLALSGVAHCMDTQDSTLYVLGSPDGLSLALYAYNLTGPDTWGHVGPLLSHTAKSPSLIPHPSGGASLLYADPADISLKHSVWRPGEGEASIQVAMSGTAGDHCYDNHDRLVVIGYDSPSLKVRIGQRNSDGSTYTFPYAAAALSLGGYTPKEATPSLEVLPSGKLSLMFVETGGTMVLAVCDSLPDAGPGTWSVVG